MLNLLQVWIIFIFIDLIIVKDFDYLILNFSERFLVNLSLSSLALLLIIIIFSRVKKHILFFILIIPTIIQTTYFEIYRKMVSSFGFQTFLEDSEMVLFLWFENINILKTLFLTLIIWFLIGKIQKIDLSKKILIPIYFLLISIYSLIIFSWYSVPNFQNSIISYYGSLFDSIRIGAYSNFKINRPKLEIAKKKNLPNIIYIVGESLVLSHTSLYGYERDTTPNLKKLEVENKIVKFENAIAIGTKTRLSVPYMLIGLEGIDPKGEIYKYPTILNYMKSIGYETSFIASQDLSWGGLKDFLIDKDVDYFVNGTKYNPNARVHKGTDDLIIVENEVLPIIRNAKNPFFMVYQMDGSHYPYSKHSPKEFKRWKEDSANSVNSFDNTVLYTDFVLNKIIENMRIKYPNSWIFYSADHGQNLGGKGGMFNDNFEKDVIHNMMFISPPISYLKKLKNLKNSPISQTDIVPTILDIVNLQPIKPLDGFSLLRDIPQDRLRVSSTFMPTLHNSPEATIVFPNLNYWYIDFVKMSVTLEDGKNSIPYNELDDVYKNLFDKKLENLDR